MSSQEFPPEFQPLPCPYVVFRAAGNKRSINAETGKLSSAAFIRVPEKDEDGISVYLGEVDTCIKASQQLKKTYAVGSLHVGHIRSIPTEGPRLDIVQDANDHGLILGVPFQQEDALLAERLAGALADHARTCWELKRTQQDA